MKLVNTVVPLERLENETLRWWCCVLLSAFYSLLTTSYSSLIADYSFLISYSTFTLFPWPHTWLNRKCTSVVRVNDGET
jgi:hypothetical protein